jgi:hypothetical protein
MRFSTAKAKRNPTENLLPSILTARTRSPVFRAYGRYLDEEIGREREFATAWGRQFKVGPARHFSKGPSQQS